MYVNTMPGRKEKICIPGKRFVEVLESNLPVIMELNKSAGK